jgi:hypothetical protein
VLIYDFVSFVFCWSPTDGHCLLNGDGGIRYQAERKHENMGSQYHATTERQICFTFQDERSWLSFEVTTVDDYGLILTKG